MPDLKDLGPVDVIHLALAVEPVLALLLVHRGPQVQPDHRRRMETEAKAKVVASVWGAK